MSDSVMQDYNGPDWPLGVIVVAIPGTPVSIMSLVDPTNVNDPSTPTPPIPNSPTRPSADYTRRCQQILFQGYKKGSDGLTQNMGNIYVVRVGQGTGSGNRDDYGAIVAVVPPGASFFLASAPLNRNVFSPYRYRIDADNASDAALVTLIIQ